MANLNKVLLIGNLTRDPELRHTQNNTAVARFGLAVNRRWKNQNGEQQEEVTFVDCDAWGRTAEVVNQYLAKGRPVFIEGRLKLDQWQDQQGNNRSKIKVVVENVQFLGSGQDGQQGGGQVQQRQQGQSQPQAGNQQQQAPQQQYMTEKEIEDEIPF